MNILLGSHAFAPAIGGIESCSLALAQEFLGQGHEVRVLTQTPRREPAEDLGLKVIRQPDRAALIKDVRWCDVFFQNNISLQTAWPLFLVRRPWVVCTQTWLRNPDGSTGRVNHLKRHALRWAANVYISQAVRNHVGHPGCIIPNPYDSETFRLMPEIARTRSLVFLGRLVSDKGCDLLIQALARLRGMGLALPLTIIGSGPEESALKARVATEQLEDQVQFTGPLKGQALARELNRHEIMAVPSRWEEPFGIVALEGIACGCLIVGSDGGGLPDAMGDCGLTFKRGDAQDLARAVQELLTNSKRADQCRQAMPAHLARHRVETVASRYLELFQSLVS